MTVASPSRRSIGKTAGTLARLGWMIGIALFIARPSIAAEAQLSLDQIQKMQAAYSTASARLCQSGNLVDCESAAAAKSVLAIFNTRRSRCAAGDRIACANIREMMPEMTANLLAACQTVRMAGCPHQTSPVEQQAQQQQQQRQQQRQQQQGGDSTLEPYVAPNQGTVIFQGQATPGNVNLPNAITVPPGVR